MSINSQLHIGLSWHEWVMDPENKKLFEWDRAEARRKYLIDENEYVEQILLQERIFQEKRIQQEINTTLNAMPPGGGRASASEISGGINTGIGNFAIGTFLNEDGDQVLTLELAGLEGFNRFTIT